MTQPIAFTPSPWSAERRATPRIPTSVPLTLSAGGDSIQVQLENVCLDGAKLVVSGRGKVRTRSVGEVVQLSFSGDVRCTAHVRWADVRGNLWSSQLMLGVQFSEPSEAWRNRVHELVEQYMDHIETVLL